MLGPAFEGLIRCAPHSAEPTIMNRRLVQKGNDESCNQYISTTLPRINVITTILAVGVKTTENPNFSIVTILGALSKKITEEE